jgi:hypothetical protein
MKALILFFALAAANAAYGQTTFGGSTTPEGAIPAGLLAAKMKGLDTLEAKIIGTVTGVCQKKGCWMQVDIGEGKAMRVKFKDYAFFVPKNLSGKTVVLDGHAYTASTSVAHLRHYAQDAGKSRAEIEKITEPQVDVVFEARAVIVM